MNIKAEDRVLSEEDVESGQCSEDGEVRPAKAERKARKKRSRRPRKRRHSSSSGSEGGSPSDFFNPYSVNPERLVVKAECGETVVESEEVPGAEEAPPGAAEEREAEEVVAQTFQEMQTTACEEQAQRERVWERQRRQTRYFEDVSGIDSVTGDLFGYLAGLGLSPGLVGDLLAVMNMREQPEEPLGQEEDDDGYEEMMINDIPFVEQSRELAFHGGYSPEHIADVVEPYRPQNAVAYAPQQMRKAEQPASIIDPFSIPAVGPRDPRLINTKTLLQSKSVSINKPAENAADKGSMATEKDPVAADKGIMAADSALALNIDWETTVTNVVKTHLTLYLTHNDINKEEYKSILKRAVNKILMCGERKLETDKISKFLHSYVTLTQKSRLMNNV